MFCIKGTYNAHKQCNVHLLMSAFCHIQQMYFIKTTKMNIHMMIVVLCTFAFVVDFRYAALCKSDSEICPISEITVTTYTLLFSCAHTRVQTNTHLSTHLVCGGAT